MYGIRACRIGAGPSCDRLDALALAIAQDPERVDRKRRSSVIATEDLANAIQVPFQALLASRRVEFRHASVGSHRRTRGAPPPRRHPFSSPTCTHTPTASR